MEASSERLRAILNTQARRCCRSFVRRCYGDKSQTGNVQSRCSLSDLFLFPPVGGVLKELYLMKWKQYATVLMIFSACSQYERRSQAILEPRTHRAVVATELNTVIPAKQLSSPPSPGPTQALIVEASACLMHTNPHASIQQCDCVRF